jgi:hypothetical protein
MSVAPPRAVNPFNQFFSNLITAAVDGGEQAIEATLIGFWPWLANPIAEPLLEELVDFIGDFANEQLTFFVSKLVIDFQVNGQESRVVKAAKKLDEARGQGDDNAKTAALRELIDAWGAVIRSDGLAPVHSP